MRAPSVFRGGPPGTLTRDRRPGALRPPYSWWPPGTVALERRAFRQAEMVAGSGFLIESGLCSLSGSFIY